MSAFIPSRGGGLRASNRSWRFPSVDGGSIEASSHSPQSFSGFLQCGGACGAREKVDEVGPRSFLLERTGLGAGF